MRAETPVIPLGPAPRAGAAPPPPGLRTFALAAVAVHAVGDEPAASAPPELRVLLDQRDRLGGGAHAWAEAFRKYLRAPAGADVPLLRLAEPLGLTPLEILAASLAAAVEDDVLIGRAIAHLQSPLGGSRPTLSLAATCLAEAAPPGSHPLHLLAMGAGARSGLLRLLNDSAPLPERAFTVPLHLCLALGGSDGSLPGTTLGLGGVLPVPLPSSVSEAAERHARALLSAPGRVLVLRSGSTAEGRSAAAAVAAAMDRRPLFLETESTEGLGPWLLLRELLPVFCMDLAPGERRLLPPIAGYAGPVLALCGAEGSVESLGAAALGWSLPVPSRGERRLLWEQALGTGEGAAELALRHRHGSGRIAHLGRLARHEAVLRGHGQPRLGDVLAASRGGEGAGLEALAQLLPGNVPDEALVVSPLLQAELDGLLRRCRARDGLADDLGASASVRYSPGVRALFVGPSGTGKTLAAGWLATRLGLPLYRVDLSSVTSKYIGETEKNLAQLLARAEQSEVVLLFDEADSLFGKRTDVREANDRFANAQTNYLLQRIEAYEGIVLLTSNSRTRFDSAFARRLDLIVDFPMPGPEERRALWESHLGGHHRLEPRDLNRLAATADLGGGHIRNAVLAARVHALAEERPIEFADLVQGVAGEYRKLGRQVPVGLRPGT